MTELEKAAKEFYSIPDFDAIMPEIINYVQLLEKQNKEMIKIEITSPEISIGELAIIRDLTIELTKLRQEKTNHLAIENFAPEVFKKLIDAYKNFGNYIHK